MLGKNGNTKLIGLSIPTTIIQLLYAGGS